MSTKTVLVVDDSMEFQKFVEAAAARAGHRVVLARGEKEFKCRYRETDPDIIVLDVLMQEFDGIEVIRWLIEQNCRSHVIILTASHHVLAKAARTLAVHASGMTADIAFKPLGEERLLDLIDHDPPERFASPSNEPER